MAIVSSYGTLTAIASQSPFQLSAINTSGPFYDGYRRTYAQIYQTQPAVRTVIDFFSRNIAQLGLQAFRRVTDTDRVRLGARDHALPRTFKRPNPATTRYRFVESTVQDIGTYANAYWLKVRVPGQLGLVRLPSGQVKVAGSLIPTEYTWEPLLSAPQKFAPSEIVHFRLYDPANAVLGFPPLETLRRVLAEEAASAEYRQYMWKNSARFESVIERPAGAPPKWDRENFRKQWQEFAGARSGMTPILEDGMTLKPMSFNARDSQYIEARKLSREEVAAAYHVPLPMVGILDHATFSNIREQHKQLYQDCLGPWLVMLEEEIELQLLPEFDDVDDVYVEFNIAEKLKGSFEEQADSLQRAVGRPFMTANEARARLNLPRSDDPSADKLAEAAPGQALSQPAKEGGPADKKAVRATLERFANRQNARIEKDPPDERAARFSVGRWRTELQADLMPLLGVQAQAQAERITDDTFALLAAGQRAWNVERLNAEVDRLSEVERG